MSNSSDIEHPAADDDQVRPLRHRDNPVDLGITEPVENKNTPDLFKTIMSASLTFDFVTGCIGLVTLLRESSIECCGSAIQIPNVYLWVTVIHLGLVVIEIFPVLFRRWLWLTVFNPVSSLIITSGLIYSSNREETIAVVFFELAAVAMTWYTLRFIEGKRFCCSPHVLTLIPTGLILLIAINYLTQAGECVTSDKFEQADEERSFRFGIRRSDGTEDCKLCLADGLPWTPECASNVGSTLGSYFGTYCGDESKKFCFFEN